MNATITAAARAASIVSSEAVAPVATMLSPSAMMMNSWKRSAKCPPSMLPLLQVERAAPRQPVARRRAEVVERQRERPDERARLPVEQRPDDPRDRRHRRPRRHADERLAAAVAAAHRQQAERVARQLERHVGAREQQRAVAEGVRDRDRHPEAREHAEHQDQAHADPVGVEPVDHPGRVDPRPPDDEQQERGLRRARPGEVVQQQVRELRDREDVDEVEEQLEVRRALLAAVLVAQAQRDLVQPALPGGAHCTGRPATNASICALPRTGGPWPNSVSSGSSAASRRSLSRFWAES